MLAHQLIGVLTAMICLSLTCFSLGASFAVRSDPQTGWKVYTLRSADENQRDRSREVQVCPQAGDNAFSFKFGGVELLEPPHSLVDLPGFRFGIPVLYPTPNRVRESRFNFEGHEYRFPPNDKAQFLHGLVHSVPWSHAEPVVQGDRVQLKTWLDVQPGSPVFERFPIRHRIELTFSLSPKGLHYDLAVTNQDTRRLPFGFAIHPYFHILGERSQTFVSIPATSHMEATKELLPTGKLDPLDGSPLDLRQPVSLSKLDLDDVYFGMRPDHPAFYEARDRKVRVTLRASDIFTHVVIYCPPSRPFFCLENQTCSTDAHNLFAKGLTKEAHLLTLDPGGTQRGWIEIEPARIED